MYKKRLHINYWLILAFLVVITACNTTKTTTDKEKEPVTEPEEKPKEKDTNIYNLMGKSSESMKKGILTRTKYVATENSVFKVSQDEGAQSLGDITYFVMEKEDEITFSSDTIKKKFIKDDFSLDYNMNGERQLSHEYGALNGIEAIFDVTEGGVWQLTNKENFKTELLPLLSVEEATIANYHKDGNIKLYKTFYPTEVQVGDSWT